MNPFEYRGKSPRMSAPNWDGPFFRPHMCGESREDQPRSPQPLFLDAMEPGGEGVWLLTLGGFARYRLGNEKRLLGPGDCLVVHKPDQGWLIRETAGFPWHYIWVHVIGEESLRMFKYLQRRYGTFQSFERDAPVVRAARRLVQALQQQPHRTAHEWSRRTFDFLMAWWECAEAVHAPARLSDLDSPHTSRIVSLAARSIKEFSREVGYSRQHLHVKLKEQWGRPPGQVLREVRLREAARLLRTTDLGIADIAERVGFTAATSLSRAFQRAFGVPPSTYRRRHEEIDAQLKRPN